MTTYIIRFVEGQSLIGEGNNPSEAVHDAYHKNGFLPLCKIAEIVPLEEQSEIALKQESEPAIHTSQKSKTRK